MLQGARESALADLETWLKTLDAPPPEGEFMRRIQTILGNAFDSLDKATISKAVEDMYTFYKLTDLLTPGIDVAFGGADLRTVDFLANLDNFYLTKFIKNPDVAAQLNEMIKELYLEGGDGLFGMGEEGLQEIQNFLSQKMIDLSDAQTQRIVDTAVQRARNWAHISQMNDAAITEVVVFEPTKDCPFCQQIDGSVIGVETAYNNMVHLSKMSPQEYDDYLKDENNQPSLLNAQSFVDRGMLPPYHPHCHGRIINRIKG